MMSSYFSVNSEKSAQKLSMAEQVLLILGLIFIALPSAPFQLQTHVALQIAVVLCGIFVVILERRFPPIGMPNLVLIFVIFAATIFSSSNVPWQILLSQANHLWQYSLLLLFFVAFWSREAISTEIMTNRLIFILLAASTTFSFITEYSTRGYIHEFSINTFMFLILVLFGKYRVIWALVVLGIYFVIFIFSDRFSPLLVLLLLALGRFLPISSKLAKFAALFLILFPPSVYLTIAPEVLYELRRWDHNTYIRAEFIRAAFSNLQENPIFGMGFGPNYRPSNYAYLSTHPLLTNGNLLAIVPNHHSVFDLAYRLGIPAAAIFIWANFIAPVVKSDRLANSLMLVLAVSLSLNAWLENQLHLPMVGLISGILITKARA